MSWTLKTLTTCPPGEFRYQQQSPSGKIVKFDPDPDIHHLAVVVADWRRANNVPRGTVDEALEDIVAYTCQRLGNHDRWCYNTDKSLTAILPKRSKSGCMGCGAHLH